MVGNVLGIDRMVNQNIDMHPHPPSFCWSRLLPWESYLCSVQEKQGMLGTLWVFITYELPSRKLQSENKCCVLIVMMYYTEFFGISFFSFSWDYYLSHSILRTHKEHVYLSWRKIIKQRKTEAALLAHLPRGEHLQTDRKAHVSDQACLVMCLHQRHRS